RAGVGLRVTLAPDLFAGEHPGQVALLLLPGAHQPDRRSDPIESELIGAIQRQAEAQDFILVDRLIDERGARSAVLLRPVQRDVTSRMEPLMILAELGPALVVAHIEQARCRRTQAVAALAENFFGILFEPCAKGTAKLVLLGRVAEVHRESLLLA